jgi:hypothetical protein
VKRALLLLVLFGCAHNPPPPPPTPPPMVPRAAVDAMCSRMHSEGINTELRAVRTSQPLVTPQAMAALASAMFYSGRGKAEMSVAPTVPVQTSGSCVSRAIDAVSARDADVMVVEFSSPFANPFARNQLGVFARVSLANEAATWYWIPIAGRGDTWAAASPLMLSIRE